MPASSSNDFSSVVVPFGKHAGKTMEEIPSDYLLWLAENARDDSIATAADQEWQWREKYNAHKEA